MKRLKHFLLNGLSLKLVVVLASLAAWVGLGLHFGVITATTTTTVVAPAASPSPVATVTIWRGEWSWEKGTALVDAGHRDLALRYAACVVPRSTEVVRHHGGWETHRVTVVDGAHRGCTGNVPSGVLVAYGEGASLRVVVE